MRVKNIVLKNLFSFYGKQTINFEKKTLILAENGFGKTSLLNAIKLALGQKKIKIESILNNQSVDKECFIEVDFDEFILKRVWDFNENFENLTIHLDNNVLTNYEAEEFLKEKFPIELIDFIFFDGEVEKDLVLLKSNKIKRIFEYSFDLDILSNMIVDTKKVANSLSNKLGNEEVVQFQNLQKEESLLSNQIEYLEEKKITFDKNIRKINELIRLNELKIRNRSRALDSIEDSIEKNRAKLTKEIEIFQEINLYQLPLILNSELLTKVKHKTTNSIEIIDRKEFEITFETFINSLGSPLSKAEILQNFYHFLAVDNQVSINIKKSTLKKILVKLIALIEKKENLVLKFEQLKEKLLKKDDLRELERNNIVLKKDKKDKELEIVLHEEKISETVIKYKEIHKRLRLEFISKRDKYSKIKAIEELYSLSEVSQEVYNQKLVGSLSRFNKLFSEKIKLFLETYQHIEKIYINEKFKIVLEDGDENLLDILLLSAGQKQILSFILISTILEFKQFVNFIFIDTPFGRLSNNSRDFIFNNYYLNFSHLTLLVTSSEYDYLQKKKSSFKKYMIEQNKLGSTIGVLKGD